MNTLEFEQNDPALNLKLQCHLINVIRKKSHGARSEITPTDLQIMFLEHRLRLRIQNPPRGHQTATFAAFIDALSNALSPELQNLILASGSRNPSLQTDRMPKPVSGDMTQALAVFFHEEQIWNLQRQIREAYERSGSTTPRYEFCNYVQDRTLITGTPRGILGRALHIAARQYIYHPELPLSLQRCLHALNETYGAEDLLVPPCEFQGGSTQKNTGKKSRKHTLSLATFKTLKASYASVLPLLAAMDVIWCGRYLPSHSLSAWTGSQEQSGRDYRPGHSFMDTPEDLDIARRTLSYTRWFRNWGLQHGSRKAQNRLLDPATTPEIESDVPEAYAMTAMPTTMDQTQESAASRSCASGAFALPLAPLPEPLLKALQSYRDSNTKKPETGTGEG